MKRKASKIIVILLLAFCLIFFGVAAGFWWFVKTGRLQAFIERRVEEASGMRVEMKSIQFLWPMGADIEAVTLAHRGHADTPLLTCPRLKMTSSPLNLLRRHLVSLTLVAPRITMVMDEQGNSNLPVFASESTGGRPLSIGAIKIVNGEIDADLPTIKAKLEGILISLREPIIPAFNKKTLRLNVDSAKITLVRENQERVPVNLKRVESKFFLDPTASAIEIEGNIDALVTTEVPYLLLPPDIHIGLSLAADYFPERDSLENGVFDFTVPLFSEVHLFGSVSNLVSDEPSPNLNLTVETPELANLLEYNELFKRPIYKDLSLSGALTLNGEIRGSSKDMKLSLRAIAENALVEWRGFVLEELNMEMPLNIDAGGFSLGTGEISAKKGLFPVNGQKLEVESLSGLVSANRSRVDVSEFSMKLGKVGELSSEGAYEFDSGLLHAKARMAEVPVADVLAFVSSTVHKVPDNLAAGGMVQLDCGVDARLGSELEKVNVAYNVSLKDGEFSSGEFMTVAGIIGELSGNVAAEAPREVWEVDARGVVGNFEILLGTFYKDFSKRRFPFSVSGEYVLKEGLFRNAAALMDFGEIGKIAASGSVQVASPLEAAVGIKSDEIDLGELFEEVGKEVLSEISPLFREAEVGGLTSGECAIRIHGDRWESDGVIRLTGGRFALDQKKSAAASVSADFPFEIFIPQEEQGDLTQFVQEDYGRITLDNANIGPLDLPSLTLDVALKKNTLHVKGPISADIFDGRINLGEVRGENLFGQSPGFTTSLSTESIDVGQAWKMFDLPMTISGALTSHFPKVVLTRDSLTTEGAARVDMFGGTIDIDSVGIEQPFSPVRTFRADLEFTDIDLSTLTEMLGFGAISGIMEGTLEGLEISQGQPAAFEADFGTVPRKGVSQRINFDAVQNITILGTGRGFQASVGRGFASFFEEFRYDTIGFYLTLKNDNFRMRGKVVQGDTEYFVKGVLLGPSINVINRNPGQTVSFKSMLERINRIKTERSTGDK